MLSQVGGYDELDSSGALRIWRSGNCFRDRAKKMVARDMIRFGIWKGTCVYLLPDRRNAHDSAKEILLIRFNQEGAERTNVPPVDVRVRGP